MTQTTGDETRISTASAIDLAGSEDNRRTDNNKDRLVESASINKSLFVLAQCVEAISKKQARIPYRESKMTRILSLGQNDGLTVMILNLAPVRSYHLDTLSSLNFANRTKRIEVNEVENQPFFREQPGKSKLDAVPSSSVNVASMHRQPLRPKVPSQYGHLREVASSVAKPTKQFSVYSDKGRPTVRPSNVANSSQARSSTVPVKSPKRTSSEAIPSLGRPSKLSRPNEQFRTFKAPDAGMSKDAIEALIERKVIEALAERAEHSTVSNGDPISDEVQKRLEALEKRVEGKETERAEGLQYLLMAKQHHVRGEDASALKMYQLALPHFPGNEKLVRKVAALRERIAARKAGKLSPAKVRQNSVVVEEPAPVERPAPVARRKPTTEEDGSYHEAQEEEQATYDEDDDFVYRPRTKIRRPQSTKLERPPTISSLPRSAEQASPELVVKHSPPPDSSEEDSEDELAAALTSLQTPRTKHLLAIINTKNVSRIKLLKGVGAKRAEAIVNCLCDLDGDGDGDARVTSLVQLGKLRGVGVKTVENMRAGVLV